MNNCNFLIIFFLNPLENLIPYQLFLVFVFIVSLFFIKKKYFKYFFLFFSILASLALIIELFAVYEIAFSTKLLSLNKFEKKVLLELCGFCHLLFLPLWYIKKKCKIH